MTKCSAPYCLSGAVLIPASVTVDLLVCLHGNVDQSVSAPFDHYFSVLYRDRPSWCAAYRRACPLKGRIRCWRVVPFVMADRLQVADLILDLPRRRVLRGGEKIALSHKEFCLLELLVRHHSEVLPRSRIASQVWDMNFDSDTNVIDVAIRRLRAKVDEGFEPKLIHTVRGMGYKLDVEAENV